MTTNGWHAHGAGATKTWEASFLGFLCLVLYSPDSGRSNHNFAWAHWKSGGIHQGGHTRASLLTYCEREDITLPELPEEWCPDEEPATPYSLADDPRLREVVRTKWGEARWSEADGDYYLLVGESRIGNHVAAVYPCGAWYAYTGRTGELDLFSRGKATNPANAYDEVMAALRDLGSLVDEESDADGWIPWGGGECPVPAGAVVEYRLCDGDVFAESASVLRWGHEGNSGDITAYRIISSPEPSEKPDANAGAVQPPTLRDRLLNLSTRMWLDGSPYANELRDLARELDGGAR